MQYSDPHNKQWFQDKRYLFTSMQLTQSLLSMKPLITLFRNSLQKDIIQQQKSKDIDHIRYVLLTPFINLLFFHKPFIFYRWYIGIRSQPSSTSKTYTTILSGEAERIPGLTKTKVIHKINHLSTINAWTIEHEFIKYMLKVHHLQTFNKSFTFGLGPIPPAGIQNTLYTITLIRGLITHSTYRAYEKELPSTLSQLKKLVTRGKEANKIVSNYVDSLTSTWNPCSAKLGKYDFVSDMPHPSSLDPVIELSTNPETFHTDLVNKCQRHHHSNKCIRIDKRTKKEICKHDFPKKHIDETVIVVLPYSRNKDNQDIYWKVDIQTRRNDAWLNQFSRLILNHWQVQPLFLSLSIFLL